ncbi:MAG: hypothetical protein ACI3YI_07815 [Bacteroidaceae bacterium]
MKTQEKRDTNEQDVMIEKELRRFGLTARVFSVIVENLDINEITQDCIDHIDIYRLYQASCHANCLDDSIFCDTEELKGYYYQDLKKEANKKVPFSITDLETLVKEYNEKGRKCGIKHITLDTEAKHANLEFGWLQKGARNLLHLLSYGPMGKRFDIIYGLCMKYDFEIN